GTRAGTYLDLGGDVERPGGRVDNRCAGDADLGRHVELPGLRGRDAGSARRRVDQAVVPERGTGIVGIERIDAIDLGRDKNDVVNSLPGDRDIRHVEGLR